MHLEALEEELEELKKKNSMSFDEYLVNFDDDVTDLETLTMMILLSLICHKDLCPNSLSASSSPTSISSQSSTSLTSDCTFDSTLDFADTPPPDEASSSATKGSHLDEVFLKKLPHFIKTFNDSNHCDKNKLIALVNIVIGSDDRIICDDDNILFNSNTLNKSRSNSWSSARQVR